MKLCLNTFRMELLVFVRRAYVFIRRSQAAFVHRWRICTLFKCLSDINDQCASAPTLKFGSRIDFTFMARPSDRIIDFYRPLMLPERSRGLYSYNSLMLCVREMIILLTSHISALLCGTVARREFLHEFFTRFFSRILVFLSFSYIVFLIPQYFLYPKRILDREMTIRFVAIIARRSRSHYLAVDQSRILRVIHDGPCNLDSTVEIRVISNESFS